MKTYRVGLVALVAAGLALASAVWLPWASPRTSSTTERSPGNAVQPDVQVRGLSLVAQDESAVTWQILAERAAFSQTEQYARIDRVDAKIAGNTTDVWHITATQGMVDRSTGHMVVEGQVRIRQRGGYTIDTDKLHWDATRRLLYTDTPVVIQNDTVAITGRGLQGMIDQHRLTLEHDVRASFRLPEPR